MANERVTVTLPREVVNDIDQRSTNRSRFVLVAVRHELERRRREDLRQSLRNPHPESEETAELGIEDWAKSLPAEDAELLDKGAGTNVRWRQAEGWVEVEE